MKKRICLLLLLCLLLLTLTGCGDGDISSIASAPSPAPTVSPTPKPTPTPVPTPSPIGEEDYPRLLGELATKDMMEYFLQLFPDGNFEDGLTTVFIRNVIRSNMGTDYVYEWVADFLHSIESDDKENPSRYEYDITKLNGVLDVFTDKPVLEDPEEPNIHVEAGKVIVDGSRGYASGIQTTEITNAVASDKEILLEYTVVDESYGTKIYRKALFVKNAAGQYRLFEVSTFPSLVVDSGSCGNNLSWTLDESGLLTISGTGPMNDYAPYGVGFGPEVDGKTAAGMITPWSELINTYRATQIPVRRAVIEDGVTALGQGAFLRCDKMESITIPASVKTIGKTAFGGCSMLSVLVMPEGVTFLGNLAFIDCSSLKEVSLPASLTNIDPSAYSENVKTVKYAGSWTQWRNVTGAPPPENVIVAINDMPTPGPTPVPTPEPVAQLSAEEAYQIARERFDQIKAEQGWTFKDAMLYSDSPEDYGGALHYDFSLNIIGLNGMPTKSYANLKVNAVTGECYDINLSNF